MTDPLLKTLDDIEARDLPLVGGKAFNLATLRRHLRKKPPPGRGGARLRRRKELL